MEPRYLLVHGNWSRPFLIVGEQRNEATGKPSPPEFLMQFTAYFGTYRVDGVRDEIVHNVITSLNGLQR